MFVLLAVVVWRWIFPFNQFRVGVSMLHFVFLDNYRQELVITCLGMEEELWFLFLPRVAQVIAQLLCVTLQKKERKIK